MKLALFCLLALVLVGCNSRPAPISNEDCFVRLKENDIELEKPKPGEWLYEHPEPGQTFDEYVESSPVRATESENKIYIQPIGDFTAEQRRLIKNTAEYLNLFFTKEIEVLPLISDHFVPDSLKRYTGTDKEQLLTTPILDYLQKNRPKDGLIIMAITVKDLYPGPTWNFVFGEARIKKRVGVSSVHRYSNDLKDSTHYRKCLERLIKTSSHEMSHMLSCEHCTFAVCVMNGSNNMVESDSRPNRLCSLCLKKIQWNLGFDIQKRLEALTNYFRKNKLQSDWQFAHHDIESLR